MELLPDSETLEQSLLYRYPFEAAAHTPSKLTATQLKGRWIDQEISDGATVKATRPVPMREKPFLEKGLSATEAGTATHLAMQFLRYKACTTAEGVREELSRLVREEFLTPAQAAAVDPEKILRFFLSPLGERVLGVSEVCREFKFSILMDAGAYRPEAAGEKILLQGVTDCCLIENEGITVLDFKTDRVRPGGEMERAQRYRGQLEGYAAALTRIFGRPVREKILYFFETGNAVCFQAENETSES